MMTTDQLHRLHAASPFVPFTIHIADGTTHEVPHPEFLAHAPGTRIALVADANGVGSYIGLLLVTKLSVRQPENAGR
jgi:hypothetical protein